MPTTFDICVEHLATQYFGLVTISGVASSHRMGGAKLRVSGAEIPQWGPGASGGEAPKSRKTLYKFSA